jgi:hypothetical protein
MSEGTGAASDDDVRWRQEQDRLALERLRDEQIAESDRQAEERERRRRHFRSPGLGRLAVAALAWFVIIEALWLVIGRPLGGDNASSGDKGLMIALYLVAAGVCLSVACIERGRR